MKRFTTSLSPKVRRAGVLTLMCCALFLLPVAVSAATSSSSETPSEQAQAEMEIAAQQHEEQYQALLEAEREQGLCANVLAEGIENRECERIVEDVAALDATGGAE